MPRYHTIGGYPNSDPYAEDRYAMSMPDDFNPNAPEPVAKCCPECGYNPDEALLIDQALDALQKFVDHYPHGVNPDLNAAYSQARVVLANAEGRGLRHKVEDEISF